MDDRVKFPLEDKFSFSFDKSLQSKLSYETLLYDEYCKLKALNALHL